MPKSEPDPKSTSIRVRRLRRLAIGVGLVLLLLVVGRLLLPTMLEAGLSAWATRALDAPVSIGRIDLALWRGEAVVESLRVGPVVRVTTLEADPEPEGVEPLGDVVAPDAGPPSAVDAPDEGGARPAPGDAPDSGPERGEAPDAPGGPPPLLTLARLELEIDWASLLERRVHLARLEIDEPALRLRRTVGQGLNVAALGGRDEGPIEPQDASPRREGKEGHDASTRASSIWPVTIDHFVLRNGRLLARDQTVERSHAVEIELDEIRIEHFATDGQSPPAPTRVTVDGSIADAPLRADVDVARVEDGLDLVGTVEVERLPLAQGRAYLRRVGWRGLEGEMDLSVELRDARSEGLAWAIRLALRDAGVEGATSGDAPPLRLAVDRLDVDAELEAPWAAAVESDADPTDLQLSGRVEARELRAQQASLFRFDARSLDGDLDRLRWTRVRADGEDEPDDGRGEDTPVPVGHPGVEIGIARIDLDEPELVLTRDVEGRLLLPTFADPDGTGVVGPDGVTPADVTTAVTWKIDRVSVEQGTLRLTDRTVEPYAVVEADDVHGALEGFAWPEGRIDRISLRGDMGGDEPVELSGRMSLPELDAKLRGSRVPLGPLNPYVSAFTGYVADRGAASVESEISADGRGYRADNHLVLHDLGFAGSEGESVFRKRFGLPLSLAMALLRDVRGDVALDFVFEGERGAKAGVSLGSVMTSALRSAVVGALATPLKLVGSVVMRGGEIQRFEPEPLACAPGEARLAPASQAALDRLARALSAHPQLAIRLTGESTPTDVDALAEPEAPIETLVDGAGPREEARHAAGELARERARSVCRRLLEEYGVPRERIQLAWADAPRADAFSGIDVALAARSALPEEAEVCTAPSEG